MRVKLPPRLAVCAGFCRPGARIADIGTDHALLPLYLVQSGTASSAVASAINPEPLARAAENLERCCEGDPALRDKISLVLCGGLDKIDPASVDDIFIAGMGGDLISDIISAAPWLTDGRYRLTLQPMSKPERLRARLGELGFAVFDEIPVVDSGKVYSVMSCGYDGARREPDIYDLYCGRVPEKINCSDDAVRGAAIRYLDNVRHRLGDVKKGAALSGDKSLEARLGAVIDTITEKLDTYG